MGGYEWFIGLYPLTEDPGTGKRVVRERKF
jgi:hypothetical protein